MNIPQWLTPWRRKSALTLADIGLLGGGGRRSKSGASVNWKTALEVTTALACARVIAEGIAQVPLKLFRESEDGTSRLPATDHPLYDLLHREPNETQTSFEFRESLGLHLVFTGNAYSFKNVVRGRIVELIQFEPQNVAVRRWPDGSATFDVTNPDSGSVRTFSSEQIWHLRGPAWNGYLGLNAVQLAREAIGLALSTEETHAQFHKGGTQTSGVYSVDGALNAEQFKNLRDWIDKYRTGEENAHKAMILDRGAKWTSQMMTGVDAQHLETRRFQIEEICRAFRVMPIMVGYSDKASTYASAEQMFISHRVHTMSPWWTRIEQSIDANLLTEDDRGSGIYSCFVEEGLLSASVMDKKEVILGYVNGGILTPNEGRALLELNPMDDEESDDLRIPANVVGATEPDPDPSTGEPEANPAANKLARMSHQTGDCRC